MTALSPRFQAIFDKTRPICFGRFIIQIPTTASVVYGPAEVETPIEYFKGHGSRVAEHVAERMAEIQNEKEYLLDSDLQALPLFGKVISGAVPGQKIAFGSKSQIGYTIHSFVPIGNDLFVQHINSVLPRHERISIINRVAVNLRYRSEAEVPWEAGTCIEGGFVPLDQTYERVTIGIRLREFPDVHFSVEVHKNQERLAESGRLALLREQAKEEAEQRGLGALFSQIKTFRHAARRLGSWHGMEIATRMPAHAGATAAHEFRFQSLGAASDPLQPRLDVRLDSGVKNDRKASVTPSISDEEAIALWDKLINSIEVRAVSEKKDFVAEQSTSPSANLVATGSMCPQSGFWQCTEGGPIAGGRRRYFKQGELMPYATILAEPNIWQRLTGSRPGHKTATVWKFVDNEAPPAS